MFKVIDFQYVRKTRGFAALEESGPLNEICYTHTSVVTFNITRFFGFIESN